MVVALGVTITLLTLPFVPPFGVLGVVAAYLVVLGVGFWRTATDLDQHTRAGAELVALSRAGQSTPLPPAGTRLLAADLLALTGSGDAIGLAAALLRATGTSSPPSATAASAPPA